MRADLLPTGRNPLRRLMTTSLVAGLLGVLLIVYTMVHFVRDQDSAEAWMLGVGCCFLFGAIAGGLVHGVRLSHGARIAALEEVAHGNGPAAGATS